MNLINAFIWSFLRRWYGGLFDDKFGGRGVQTAIMILEYLLPYLIRQHGGLLLAWLYGYNFSFLAVPLAKFWIADEAQRKMRKVMTDGLEYRLTGYMTS